MSQSADVSNNNDVEHAVALVERIIRKLGVEPAAGRMQRDGHIAYALRRGSARVLIAVHAPTEAVDGRIRVVGPVVRIPSTDREGALCRKLLEMNASTLVGAAFAISGDEVVVLTERSLEDLDASEVESMIRTVGRVADRYDDQLAREFGAERSSDAKG